MRLDLLCALGFLVVCGCSPGGSKNSNPPTAKGEYTFRYGGIEVPMDIWMFDEEGEIADWLDRKYSDLGGGCDTPATRGGSTFLFEPINVIWLDLEATKESDARSALRDFFAQQKPPFFLEPNRDPKNRHVPWHTEGYFGRIGGRELEQHPLDMTWVDSAFPDPNNHGRVFSAYEGSHDGQPFFLTTASFSREDRGGVKSLPNPHEFISFNCARDAFSAPQGWRELNPVHIGNEFSIGNPGYRGRYFHTGDHNGTRVFVRESCKGFPPPTGERHTFRVVGTSSGFTTFTESVAAQVGTPKTAVYRIGRNDSPPGLGIYVGCDPTHGEVNVATDWWEVGNPKNNGKIYWKPYEFFCQFGDRVGTERNWVGTFDGEPARTVSKVIAYEDVTVPAASVKGAMKMLVTEYDARGRPEEPLMFWFDTKIGLLQAKETESGTTIVLVDYRPPPRMASEAGASARPALIPAAIGMIRAQQRAHLPR